MIAKIASDLWRFSRKGPLGLSSRSDHCRFLRVVVRLTAFVAGLNAWSASQMLPLRVLCAAARVSFLQCRCTSAVFWEDRLSQESASSGSRPTMCPNS
jgi:hypothetical protein